MYTRTQATHVRVAKGLADKAEAHAADGIIDLRRIVKLINEYPHCQTETQSDKLEGNVRRAGLDSSHATTHAQDAQMWVRVAQRNAGDSQRAVEGAARSAAAAERGARGASIELRDATERADEVKSAVNIIRSVD